MQSRGKLGETNPVSLSLGLVVFVVTVCAEIINLRIPGALLGVMAATFGVYWYGLEREDFAVLGQIPGEFPRFQLPSIAIENLVQAAPLAFVVVATIMVQTAATTHNFPAASRNGPSINYDFAGLARQICWRAFFGTFPVNASPPLTGIVAETGGRSKFAGLAAVALILGIAGYGTALLAHVPVAALAGTLLFVAMRIVSFGEIITICRRALSLLDPCDRDRDYCSAGRNRRCGRYRAFAAAWHMGDDQRPSHHLRACSRDLDLVAAEPRSQG